MPAPDDGAAIRAAVAGDVPALRGVIAGAGPSPAGFRGGCDGSGASGAFWPVRDCGTGPGAAAWCAPGGMTDGTWNAFPIAVHPDRQGRSPGAARRPRVTGSGRRALGAKPRLRGVRRAGAGGAACRKALAGVAA